MTIQKPPPKKGPPSQYPSAPQQAPRPAQTTVVGSGRVTLSKGGARSGAGLSVPAQPGKPGEARKPEALPVSVEPVENQVFKLTDIDQSRDSVTFNKFIEMVAPRVKLPATSFGILNAFTNIDVTAEKVSHCLKSNAYYEELFFRTIESMGGRREQRPSLEAGLVLLGMQNSRNLIIAAQAVRTVTGQHLEWTKEGRLKVQPNDILRYAIRTEEMLAGDKAAYADTAYAAGLLFDLLALISDQYAEEKKRVLGYIDTTFTHSLRTAMVATELAKVVPEFHLAKYVFGTALLHDIGKIVLAILEPKYFSFIEECERRDVPRAVRFFAETQRFGVNHALLGGLCAAGSRVFRPIQKAILHHHTPYLLRTQNRTLYQLASIVCVSTNIATNFRKINNPNDPIIAAWQGIETHDFLIDPHRLIEAVQRLN